MIDLTEARGRRFIVTLFIIFLVVIKLDSIMGYAGKFISMAKPFFIGIGIAFLLNRPMMLVEKLLSKTALRNKRGLTRGISILITLFCFIAIVYLFINFVVPELIRSVTTFLNSSDTYISNFSEFLQAVDNNLKLTEFIDITEVTEYIKGFLTKSVTVVGSSLVGITVNVISSLYTVSVALIFAIYVLGSKEAILAVIKRMVKTYTSERFYKKSLEVAHITTEVFNKYVVGQLTDACILGTMCYVGMLIFRFDYSLLISVTVAVTALIPVIGGFIGGGIAVLLLLLISPAKALYFLIFYLIIQQIDVNFIYPQLVGTSLGLPPILVLVAVLLGGSMFGFIGMLLGVPVATIVYLLIKQNMEEREKKAESV